MSVWVRVDSGVRLSVADRNDVNYANDASWRLADDGGAGDTAGAPVEPEPVKIVLPDPDKDPADLKMTELRSILSKAGVPMSDLIHKKKVEMVKMVEEGLDGDSAD